jgi:hypothetical protein
MSTFPTSGLTRAIRAYETGLHNRSDLPVQIINYNSAIVN